MMGKLDDLLYLLTESKKMFLESQQNSDYCYFLGIRKAIETIIGTEKFIVWNDITGNFEIE